MRGPGEGDRYLVSGIIVRDDVILNMRKRTSSNQNLFQMTSSVGVLGGFCKPG